jgi:hypothetical protein
MAIQYNRKEEILTRLETLGLVQNMDSAESLQAREAINQHVLEIKREYQEKERMSIMGASQLILTA